MKRLILLLMILYTTPLWSNENTPQVIIGWNTSYQQGLFHELVYDEYLGESYTLSHLTWDMENLITTGPQIQIQWDSWEISSSFRFPLYGGDGQMEDYDWMGRYSPFNTISDIEEDDWTHYSKSDVTVDKYNQFNLSGIWKYDLLSWFQPQIGLSLDYLHIRWEDTPLYYIYSYNPENSLDPIILQGYRGEFNAGNAINYEFTHITPELTGAISFFAPHSISLKLGGAYSPVSWRYTLDEHVLRDTSFKDSFYYTHKASFTGVLEKSWFSRYVTALECYYEYHHLSTGDTEIRDMDTGTAAGEVYEGAGSSGDYWRFTLFLGYSF